MNQLTTQVSSGLSIFDTGSFEQMAMIADKLASSSLIPETLRTRKEGNQMVALPHEQVAANCFRIVEQSRRWGMSPFAVVDCASVVHGKLMWEGKLIAAAVEATMGIRLDYTYSGEGLNRKVVVSGKHPDEEKIRMVEGTVTAWKTDQWKQTDYDQRLAYRGAREWARRHAPGAILGVYTTDEFNEENLRNVTPTASAPATLPFNKGAVEAHAEVVDTKAGKKGGKAAPAADPDTTQPPAVDEPKAPTRKSMYAEIKAIMAEAEITSATAEAKFKNAGAIPKGKTLIETTDEELMEVVRRAREILIPSTPKEEGK